MRRICSIFFIALFFVIINCNTNANEYFVAELEELCALRQKNNEKEKELKYQYHKFNPSADFFNDNKLFCSTDIIPKDYEVETLFKSGNPLNQKLAKWMLLYRDENVRSVIRTWYVIKSALSFNKNQCSIRFDYEQECLQLQAELLLEFK
ncbi:MAG: hypothetical protein V1874_11380 [Spirochaetota bacterium]